MMKKIKEFLQMIFLLIASFVLLAVIFMMIAAEMGFRWNITL